MNMKPGYRDTLLRAAASYLAAEKEDPNAHYDAQLELCEEILDEAAKTYVGALINEASGVNR